MNISRQRFDAALAETIRTCPPGAHEGWKADFSALHVPGVEFGRVHMIGEPAARIEARGISVLKGLSGLEIGQDLLHFWNDFVFRADPKEHFLAVTPDSVVLEGFTIHGHSYVSIQVTVDMNTRGPGVSNSHHNNSDNSG